MRYVNLSTLLVYRLVSGKVRWLLSRFINFDKLTFSKFKTDLTILTFKVIPTLL